MKKPRPIPPEVVLGNEPAPRTASSEMTDRMMWGIKRGVGRKDVGTLKKLRDMNRRQRRSYLAQSGTRRSRGSG